MLVMKKKLYWSLGIVAIYLVVKYYFPIGMLALYPVALIVTFLHELGHAFFALITGGTVHAVQINPDGSGFARVAGGATALVLMGGYIGSAIFGNLLFYCGIAKPRSARLVTALLALVMIFTGLWWFSSFFTSFLLLLFAALLFFIAKKQQFVASNFLMAVGLLSVIYIIEDYNVGPSSDINHIARVVPVFPELVWMYLFLGLVLLLSYFNLRTILRHGRNS